MPPYLLLSETFSKSYKYFEGLCLKLFESVGVNTEDVANKRRILNGMMSFLGWRFFKIRDRLDPAEIEFQRECVDQPSPALMSAFNQILATHKILQQTKVP